MTDQPSPAADTQLSLARERVELFMAEYERQWNIAAPAFRDDSASGSRRGAFLAWRELMDQTAANHFTDTTTVGLGGAFGNPPEHGPSVEKYVRAEAQGPLVHVLTRLGDTLTRYHEYTLREQGGQWRIESIVQHFDEPTEPYLEAATAQGYLAEVGPTETLLPIPPGEAGLDHNHNFAEREVTDPRDGGTTGVEVVRAGTLVTSSGALAVLDFGYGNDLARPLARTVAPGAHPVELLTAFGRNAAVRVRFSDVPAVRWAPANLPGSGHVFGVDAGCICIVDYPAYAAMSRRDKEASFERFTATGRPISEFGLGADDVGVACDSGFGDGSYPAYWGLDADDQVVELVVDFLTLARQDADGVLRHL